MTLTGEQLERKAKKILAVVVHVQFYRICHININIYFI